MPGSRETNAPDAIENTLVTEREPVEGFATFIDF